MSHAYWHGGLWLQTTVLLTADDTVELRGNFCTADGYFAADKTSFWGIKIVRERYSIARQRPAYGFVRIGGLCNGVETEVLLPVDMTV